MNIPQASPARQAVKIVVLLAAALAAGSASAQLGFGNVDVSTLTREALLPGGEVQAHLDGPFGYPVDSGDKSEQLMIATRGVNGSGRSTSITSAFASATAQANGDGGVGVSSLEFGGEQYGGEPAVRQLAAQATWAQSFTNSGTIDQTYTLHLHIPALEVQLHGVAPNRSSKSDAETATAFATVDWVVTHADGSFVNGTGWRFGLREREFQVLLGGSTYENYADIELILEGSASTSLFSNLTRHGTDYDPSFTNDAVSTDVKLGTLKPGDSLRYVYQLDAAGTTAGLERGYAAFLGDPFSVTALGDNLRLIATPAVPEPGGAALALAGLGWIAALVRRRRAPAAAR